MAITKRPYRVKYLTAEGVHRSQDFATKAAAETWVKDHPEAVSPTIGDNPKPLQARYRGPGGHEEAKRFAKKADAERWLREKKGSVDRGTWVNPTYGRMLFEDWASEWWKLTSDLRPSSRARDLSYLRTHVLPRFGSVPLAAIDAVMVKAWVADLNAAGKAAATTQKAHQILAKILAEAVEAKRIPASPCLKPKLPKIRRTEMRFLEPAEIHLLADTIHPRYRALVLLGAYAGLRIGELAGLKRSRVHPLKRSVTVSEIVTEVAGNLHWGEPKTEASLRSVSIPGPIMDELVAHMKKFSADELVFTAPEGGTLRVNAWRRRHWNPAVEAAGLLPLRPHDLRHSAVAMWIAAGIDVLHVSRRAGHTSVSFTLDRYGHRYEGAEDAAADALAKFVVPSKPDAEVVQIKKDDVG